MPPSSAQPPLDSARSFEAVLRRVLEPRVGDAGLCLDGFIEALLPEGAERMVAGEGVSEHSGDIDHLGALPRSATAAPEERHVSLPLLGISVTPVMRAGATPSLVHITAAVLPTTSAAVSVAARPLESTDSARQALYEAADEGAVRLFLRRVGVTSRKGTIVVAFVPAWTLGASSRLAGLRNRLLKDGRLVGACGVEQLRPNKQLAPRMAQVVCKVAGGSALETGVARISNALLPLLDLQPPAHAEVLRLTDHGPLTQQAAAARFGIALVALKSRVSAARRQLRRVVLAGFRLLAPDIADAFGLDAALAAVAALTAGSGAVVILRMRETLKKEGA